jgi:hypothetical protein
LVRPTAGAILFAASAHVLTDVHPALSLIAGLLVAGGVHTVKTAVIRPAVSATTAGVGNLPISIAEDVFSTVVSLLSVLVPLLLGVFLLVTMAALLWRAMHPSNP